ncbi:MAG: hypothetical protein AAFU65_17670 [Pseudomonadota bacterium]
MSRIILTPNSSDIVFEASVSPDYPLDSEVAEEERRRWIEQWLERSDTCPNGFEVLKRERLGSAADNPYQHDLRYTLRCTGV